MPWKWCHDDAETSAFNVNIIIIIIIIIIINALNQMKSAHDEQEQ